MTQSNQGFTPMPLGGGNFGMMMILNLRTAQGTCQSLAGQFLSHRKFKAPNLTQEHTSKQTSPTFSLVTRARTEAGGAEGMTAAK